MGTSGVPAITVVMPVIILAVPTIIAGVPRRTHSKKLPFLIEDYRIVINLILELCARMLT